METEKGVLTCDEVCAILKACGEAKVTKLKFRDLEVELNPTVENPSALTISGPRPRDVPCVGPLTDLDRPPSSTPVAEMTESQHEKQSAASVEQDLILLREEQIAELQITNPLMAEEMIRNGELEDEDGSDSE